MTQLGNIHSAKTRYGRIFHFVNDDPIGKALEVYGEWAQAEIDLLAAFMKLGSTVVDVGANVGTHTLAFARRVGPHGAVHAFEPQRPVFTLLQRNIVENGLCNVTAHCAGVGGIAGEMLVPALDYTSHVNVGAVELASAVGCDEGEPTPIVTIDQLDLPACDLVKIDAEGMEDAVLEGMVGTIRRLHPIIYAECNTVDTGAAILRAADWTGYRIFLTRTGAFNPDNYQSNPDNFFGVARESSLLCVPEAFCGYSPASSPLVDVIPVSDLQSLAEALLSTPRYGDATPFDRDPASLREAVEVATEEVQRLTSRVTSLERQIERDAAALAERDAARAELGAVYASTCWRVTRPLRLIKTATWRNGPTLP